MTTQQLKEKMAILRFDLESKISNFCNETGFMPEIETVISSNDITDKTGEEVCIVSAKVNVILHTIRSE